MLPAPINRIHIPLTHNTANRQKRAVVATALLTILLWQNDTLFSSCILGIANNTPTLRDVLPLYAADYPSVLITSETTENGKVLNLEIDKRNHCAIPSAARK